MGGSRAIALWANRRDQVDLMELATQLLGPPPGRGGERSERRFWWSCPFHNDGNPSFKIDLGEPTFFCFACRKAGDAINLIRHLHPEMSFAEAVAVALGEAPTTFSPIRPIREAARKRKPDDGRPSMLGAEEAEALVEVAEEALWAPVGAEALAYLRGRGFTDRTIRAHRFGWTPSLAIRGRPVGVTLPWYDGDRLAALNVRQLNGRLPKYRMVLHDRPLVYPGPEAIVPGRPAVLTEGEFDAAIVGQELADWNVSVITLGSASSSIRTEVLARLLAARPIIVATDGDEAGDRLAAEWIDLGPGRCVRVRPPCKDWGGTFLEGRSLIRYYFGRELLPPPSWEALSALHWGSEQPHEDGPATRPLPVGHPSVDDGLDPAAS